MGTIGFIAVVGMAAGLGGAALGWWLRASAGQSAAPPQRPPADEDSSNPEAERAQAVVLQLQELAAGVARKVGEHSSEVRAINAELADSSGSQEVVVAAIAKLIEANERMQRQLDEAERKLQEQARRLETSETQARTDPLTRLANRRAFDEELGRCEQRFREEEIPSTVMMIDVDHFKKFNDTHGHQAGDEVLRGVARVLRRNVRQSDLVARYGGEEFSVIFRGANVAQCREVAERARAAVAAAVFEFQGTELRVTCSAGLAELRADESAEATVKRADEALYVSKEAGRNRGHWHDGRTIHPLVSPSKRPAPASPAAEQAKAEPSGGRKTGRQKRDPATGLLNREAFREAVAKALESGPGQRCLLLAHIDRHDAIVERFGQAGGDLAARAVHQFLKAVSNDVAAAGRTSSDTFAVLLNHCSLEQAGQAAERLRRAIGRCQLPTARGIVRFTVSLGVAQAAGGDAGEELFKRANQALANAVSEGRDRCFLHDGARCRPAADFAPASGG